MTRASSHVTAFVRVTTRLQVCFISFVLMGDTDLFVMAHQPNEPFNSVAACAQEGGLAWRGALGASGGALEPGKCCCCTLVNFIWISGVWQHKASQEAPASAFMPGKGGSAMEIKCLEPRGGTMAQAEALVEKVAELGAGIRDSWAPRRVAWQGFKAMIWPSTQCPLPACSLSKPQPSACAFDQPAQGAATKVWVRLMATPLLWQGALWQGHWSSCSWLEIGVGAPALEASFEQRGFLSTDAWLQPLWRFVSEEGIILHKESPTVPPLQHMNDKFMWSS